VWLGIGVSGTPGGEMVVIEEVVTDSPATQARLRRGDLIDSFNGIPVPDAASLHRQVQNSEPGTDAVLTVTRDGNRRLIIATLAELPK
jgi:serine protease Do